MRAIMISIRPQWVAKILNGEKTIEIRKKFPKDYVGWVYIYCTKGQGLVFDNQGKGLVNSKLFPYAKNCPEHDRLVNGKVVARFWCDKVEEIKNTDRGYYFTDTCVAPEELQRLACLANHEIYEYAFLGNSSRKAYTIHITKLETFDKPRNLSQFNAYCEEDFCHCYYGKCTKCSHLVYDHENVCDKRITKAPQSWCYVEV